MWRVENADDQEWPVLRSISEKAPVETKFVINPKLLARARRARVRHTTQLADGCWHET
jgi:hypothetical protein